jgi:thiamine biosynthesis lipoprotein
MSTISPITTDAWEWRATGTTWRIYHTGGVTDPLAAAVAAAVESDEARWSRFRQDSEVSRINAAGGRPVGVSAATLHILEACIRWEAQTHGVFQPLVGGVLAAWGYRQSLLEHDAFAATSPASRRLDGRIEIDRAAGTARIPAGTRLDLGGIAKSWMAARAAALAAARCDDPALLIDAGGDLVAARGDHVVAVEMPGPAQLADAGAGAPPVAHVHVLTGQGIATSGFGRRRWRNGDGREAHHLIDPATGEPGPATHATVISDDPVAADVLAKVLSLRPDRVATTAEAAMVTAGGRVRTTAAWDAAVTR